MLIANWWPFNFVWGWKDSDKFVNLLYVPYVLFVCAGYEGENCQLDIDECEEHPCENGGQCFQRSDIQNYGAEPEFSGSEFRFADAAGFICRCLPGFTGESNFSTCVPHKTQEDRDAQFVCPFFAYRTQLLSRCKRVWIFSLPEWRKLPGLDQLVPMRVSSWIHRWESYWILKTIFFK